MKEHGGKHPAEVPTRALKSLLKKPGQSRGRTQKNRVVINEKLNEFFAADYIILIKEECCADYEEDCDCCCQEHEMIRVGNCKECRAELNLHLAGGGGGGRFADPDAGCEGMLVAGPGRGQYRCEESRRDDEDDDEDEEEEEEEEEEEDDEEEEDEEEVDGPEDEDNGDDVRMDVPVDEIDSRDSQSRCPPSPPRIQQQQETLSPPEGYKDVCEDAEIVAGRDERHLQTTACSECTDYYHQQRATGPAEQTKVNGSIDGGVQQQQQQQSIDEPAMQHVDEGIGQQTNDQAQQTTPDLHQRYLVETITMTTVTERRIVREISEEETRATSALEDAEPDGRTSSIEPPGRDDESTTSGVVVAASSANPEDNGVVEERRVPEKCVRIATDAQEFGGEDNGQTGVASDGKEHHPETTELSLTFKLGNVSLVSNSHKPNSAVRQLFPDPRFISPPPAPAGKAIAAACHEEADDEHGTSEAQKFLITTESLRLFDAVKRSKIAGSRSDSSESESSTIKRTIERNTLRRSLIGKFDTVSRKKNLRTKDLSLEERIRQLTCVDQDEETAESSASENTNTIEESEQGTEFPVRTSPSGEEHPKSERLTQGVSTMSSTSTTTTTATMTSMSTSTALDHSNLTLPLTSVNGQGTVHQSQSTYRKITDLFAQKRTVEATNLPDIGLGNSARTLGKEYSKSPLAKMNSDVRKQFLASLAPLSCVTSSSTDNQEDYYKIASRITSGSNRDSIGYNSDSSYSLEDIEAVLNGEERGYVGPPDVTRGTPTGTGADMPDNTADELLAFVEQDKTRTERIKRRYESDDRHEDPSVNGDVSGATDDAKNNEDEDDELNDYGFNRRPSVRGIKPQFGTTDEIVQQLRTRSLPPNSFVDVRTSFHATWPVYYDKSNEKIEGKEEENGDGTYAVLGKDDRETNTINRINTMQKQIDDIYQTIAETAVNVQGTLDRGPYLDGTLPRPLVSPMVRIPPADGAGLRYPDQKNGQIHYQEQHQTTNARMLRIAGGCDETTSAVYANNLQAKMRRHPAVTIANYHCNVLPATAGGAKCYRTMYFVPYNGTSDPTYQNIQRILPPHSSPNYATHIERYPYPRQGRTDQQQQTRYYPRPMGPGTGLVPPPPNALPPHAAQQTLHLHLHHHQPEDFRVPGLPGVPHGAMHPLQLQHHHQHHQIAQYHVQSVPPPSYSVITPPPSAKCATTGTSGPPSAAGYHLYQVHLARGATDVQTQTVPSLAPSASNACGTLLATSYNGVAPIPGTASSSSSSSSPALSSPTKLQHPPAPRGPATCLVAERGVPEGAASAPSHDFAQATGNAAIVATSSYVGHANIAVPATPANAQNSVYYAMNV